MNTTTRTRMRPEERRQQILNVALELFAKRGVEEVTIGDIAAEMDIVRPTIYIYFPSTNAILDAIFENLLESYWQKLEPLIKSAGDIVPNPQLVSKAFRIMHSEPYLLSILRCGGPSFQKKRHAQFNKKLRALLEPYTNSDIPYISPIIGLLIEGLAYWAIQENIQDTEELANALEQFVSHGLDKR